MRSNEPTIGGQGYKATCQSVRRNNNTLKKVNKQIQIHGPGDTAENPLPLSRRRVFQSPYTWWFSPRNGLG